MRIDHVILATRDLTATGDRLRSQHGLASIAGGRHTGLGTANRIIPLGDGYLELVTVADAAQAAGSTFGSWALGVLADADEGLMGWSVLVDDVRVHAHRLGTPVETIERAGLAAETTGMARAAADPALPFLITRRAGVPDPGAAPADHAAGPRGLAWIEVGIEPAVLDAWLGAEGASDGWPLRLRPGRSGLVGAAIRTDDGDRVIQSGRKPRDQTFPWFPA
jgi:hypothetical protein